MITPVVVARPYAKAVFALAKQGNQLELWDEALAFYAQAIQDKATQRLLGHPKCVPSVAIDFLSGLAPTGAPALIKNLFRVLAHFDRLLLIPEIAVQFHQLRLREEQTVAVKLIVAKPLSEVFLKSFQDALQRKYNQRVLLTSEVRESLIGGAIVEIGDSVVDGSIRGRLSRLSESFI